MQLKGSHGKTRKRKKAKRNYPNTLSKQNFHFALASPKQLADIQALQQNIKNLVKQINRVYAMNTSVILIPLTINLLFLSESGFFHGPYSELHRGYYHYLKEDIIDPVVNQELQKARDHYNNFYNRFWGLINTISETKGFSSYKNLDEIAKVQKVESFCLTMVKDGLRIVDQIKEKLIEWNNALENEMNTETFKRMDETDKSLSINELYTRVNDEFRSKINAEIKNIEAIRDNFYIRAEAKAAFETDTVVVYSKIILVGLSHYFVISPLINRVFPHGILQAKTPQVANWLTYKEANQAIKALKNHQAVLEETSQRNIKIARWGSLGMILLSLLYIAFYGEFLGVDFHFFFLAVLATAITNCITDFREHFLKSILKRELQKQEEALYHNLGSMLSSLQVVMGDSLESCYFILQFQEKDLAAKKVADIFKECCLRFNIEVIAKDQHIVTLFTQSAINMERMVAIKNLFSQSLAREQSISVLINQIKQIDEVIGGDELNFLIKPEIDQTNLPIVSIDLFMPIIYRKNIDDLKIIYSKNKVAVNEQDQHLVLCLTGYNFAVQTGFDAFLKEFKLHKIKNQDSHQGPGWQEPTKGKGKPRDKTKEQAELPVEEKDHPIPARSTRHIFWRQGGVYDSNAEDNNIYPVPLSRIHDTKAIQKTGLFVKNELDQSKLPKWVNKAINQHIANPSLKASRGKQGIVHCREFKRDMNNGRWFSAVAKEKLLGKKGKVRSYFMEEKADTGETLWKLRGISFTHGK